MTITAAELKKEGITSLSGMTQPGTCFDITKRDIPPAHREEFVSICEMVADFYEKVKA